MNLFGINQKGVFTTDTKGFNNKLQYDKSTETHESAVIELENADFGGRGIYRPQRIKNTKESDNMRTGDIKAETFRSIVEKIMYKQALAVSEHDQGYWSPKSTSHRVLELAKALAADDVERVNQMKSGFIKGFHDARVLNGGTLPAECYDTYKQAVEYFDAWMTGTAL